MALHRDEDDRKGAKKRPVPLTRKRGKKQGGPKRVKR